MDSSRSRKVFISILGTGNYKPCIYRQGDFTSTKTRFIQEATLDFLRARSEWCATDAAYIFLTPTARSANWQAVPIDSRTDSPKDYAGLEPTVSQMGLPFPVEPVEISEEGDEEAIWSVFRSIYDQIREGDRLYIDITHSFRYLPMLLLVLTNYAKELKGAEMVSITYGNWEAKTEMKPIVDLGALIELQDWTVAAGEFLRNGRASRLEELTKERVTPILRKSEKKDKNAIRLRKLVDRLTTVSQSLTTIRGKKILEGKIFEELDKYTHGLDAGLIAPLSPLIEKIKDSFGDFDTKPSVSNGFAAARWCHRMQLYQQSITILQETMKAYVAASHGYPSDDEDYTELAAKAFHFHTAKGSIPEDEWQLGESDPTDREKRAEVVRQFLAGSAVRELSQLYSEIKQIRNDFNHAGIRSNAVKGRDIPDKIEKLITRTEEVLRGKQTVEPLPTPPSGAPLLINLSNHPSASWGARQREAAEMYGEIEDMTFLAIPPEAGEREIADLAEEYVARIAERAETRDVTVHIMGEMTFCYAVITRLQPLGIPCIASTTRRQITEAADGVKEVHFDFETFRKYPGA
ncbi:TIGR02221 family CRISPR-associated protein [uncultured Porphyromonas sp.]|uniref:TIGR02221 family CRISPR-associated protein n=1 Tax=uncultured Porphyromonas sp. TaxID=159274 RepID=UPI00259742E9|nr:TIGR02221 family CRISPR-associated protein [uncultured Porphyromonas sp.]